MVNYSSNLAKDSQQGAVALLEFKKLVYESTFTKRTRVMSIVNSVLSPKRPFPGGFWQGPKRPGKAGFSGRFQPRFLAGAQV
jgi:hypothetical protein